MLEVDALTVRFGGVCPLNGITLTFDRGTWGLIGPNGAGKTTFFNVLSGFIKPISGGVRAYGDDLLAMPAHRRARWGMRRTFQQAQVISKLTVTENVELALDHTGGRGSAPGIDEVLQFVGLGRRAQSPGAKLNAMERRLLELARALVGTPRLVLLDEPAAGLSDNESFELGRLVAQVPERFGALVILIDHDMELVASTCAHTAVLDFGNVIASGRTAEVLRDPQVMRAYLGNEEAA
jgi:branched-chain amino acid transport system ATP-binding protein